jgi:hypothetical protein
MPEEQHDMASCMCAARPPCMQVAFSHDDRTAHLCCCKECAEQMEARGMGCPLCGRPGITVTVYT